MEKTAASTAESILLLGIGILVFLTPIKFGFPVDCTDMGFPQNILGWIFFQWPHGIFHIGIIIIFALWLTFCVAIGKVRIRYSILDIVILIFLLTAAVSAVKAPNIHQAHLCLFQYFIYALTYFLILNLLENEKDFRFILSTLVISAALISIYAIYQYYIGLPETRTFANQYLSKNIPEQLQDRLKSNRVFATFIYPNTLAGYLILCIPLVLACRRILRIRKWFHILIVLIMFYALYLTFHRGSGAVDKIKNTSIVRWEYWTAGIKMIRDHPVSGIGPCNFSALYPLYKLDTAEEVQFAHNNFLQIWAEQGVLGGLFFLLIWFIVLKKSVSMSRLKSGVHCLGKYWTLGFSLGVPERLILWGLRIGLTAFLIHNLVDFDWYVPGVTIIAWAFIGILMRISKGCREKIIQIKKWWVKGIILLCAAAVFLSVLFYIERNLVAEYYFCEARNAFANKDAVFGEVLGRASMKMDVDNPDVYFLLAQICVSRADYANSISWYKKAIKYSPYASAFYYHMALSYIYQMQITGDISLMKDAGGAFKQAVLFCPANPFYHFHLARFYEADKQMDLAVKEYEKCLYLNDRIEKEYKSTGKMIKHLILTSDLAEDIRKKIRERGG